MSTINESLMGMGKLMVFFRVNHDQRGSSQQNRLIHKSLKSTPHPTMSKDMGVMCYVCIEYLTCKVELIYHVCNCYRQFCHPLFLYTFELSLVIQDASQ